MRLTATSRHFMPLPLVASTCEYCSEVWTINVKKLNVVIDVCEFAKASDFPGSFSLFFLSQLSRLVTHFG